MFREGSPFMEFLTVAALLLLAGVAIFLLALFRPGEASAGAFFTHAAETLLGAVIALAYAARGVTAGRDVTVNPDTATKKPTDSGGS